MLFQASLLTLFSTTLASPIKRNDAPQVPGFDYQNDKIRGVNLGGWFVIEPWITPSYFNQGWNSSDIPVDEYHLSQYLGKEKAFEVLEKHWDTWINETDFEKMASWGLNFARIPVGYWAFLDRPEDPYVQGQLKYLDRAVEWARKHGIKLWMDMHGVPGSQNGLDNSGIRDVYQWQNDSTTNMHDTYIALQTMIDRYGGKDMEDVVVGIENVNEPFYTHVDMEKLHDYYNKSYDMLRKKNTNQGGVFHDAYEPIGYMNDWLNTPDHYNVIIDHHFYQWGSLEDLQMSTEDHVKQACDIGQQMKQLDNKWHVVGEWSPAMTDCTPLLNGVYRGARYDASYNNTVYVGSCKDINDLSKWTDEQKENTRKFAEAQVEAYEYGGSGWVMWVYKAENSVEWDFRSLIENGMFPNPVTNLKYPNQCGF